MSIPDGNYLKGLADITARIGQVIGHLGNVTEDGMKAIVTDIQQVAADRAPIDTGTLRGSAFNEVATEGDEIIGSVHFPEKYAARQHEHVEYQHPQGGEAKYLEKTMIEKADQVKAQLGAALSDLFGGG